MIPEKSIADVGQIFSHGLGQLWGHFNGSNVALRKCISFPSLILIINPGDAPKTSFAHLIPFLAALTMDEARVNSLKVANENKPKASEREVNINPQQQRMPQQQSDPRAEDWAGNNSWCGKDRAMTFTAFEIHKDLVEREGFDPQTNEYYAEVDKRIRLEFPQKFDRKEGQTSKPTQTVASVNRSTVRPGRKTVRLTSSQVAIAKKLGVPLEEYAKQLKTTEGA